MATMQAIGTLPDGRTIYGDPNAGYQIDPLTGQMVSGFLSPDGSWAVNTGQTGPTGGLSPLDLSQIAPGLTQQMAWNQNEAAYKANQAALPMDTVRAKQASDLASYQNTQDSFFAPSKFKLPTPANPYAALTPTAKVADPGAYSFKPSSYTSFNPMYNYDVPNMVGNYLTGPNSDKTGNIASQVTLTPGYSYRLVDHNTGQTIAEGSDPATFAKIQDLYQNTLNPEGRKANWTLYQGNSKAPSSTPLGAASYDKASSLYYTPVAGDLPNKGGLLSTIASIGLPIAGALLAGPLGLGALGLGTAGTAGVGAALGSTINGVAQGQSIGDILKGAALSGLGTYAGGSLLGKLGSAGSTGAGVTSPSVLGASDIGSLASQGAANAAGALGSTAAGSVAGGALGDLGSQIVVQGARTGLGSMLGNAVGGGLGSVSSGLLNSALTPSQAANAGGLNSISNGPITPQNTVGGLTNDQIVVLARAGFSPTAIAKLVAGGTLAGGGLGVISSGAISPPPSSGPGLSPEQSGVSGTTSGPGLSPEQSGVAGTGTAGTGTAASTTAGLTTLQKIQAAIKAGGILGNLLTNGSTGSAGSVPGGFGAVPASFTSTAMPAPNMPGLTTTGQRDMSKTNWATYGQGPEQSFFNAVPTSPVHLARGGQPVPSYESLSPQEREAIDYTRRNMATGIVQHNPDKSLTSFKGAIEDFPDGTIRYFPTFWNGKELPLDAARDRAVNSGIDWPQYPSYDAGLQREAQIHRLMEKEANAYQAGDRSFLKGYAAGGPLSDHAVTGPGSGRDDKIPAMLSDGEYVIDAETVALLGDGSNKEGARKLDTLRANIRKQKGRALAKGAISSDAKHPEAYFNGGRV